MDFAYSPRTQELQAKLLRFMDDYIYPAEARYTAEIEANTKAGKRWTPLETIEELATELQPYTAEANQNNLKSITDFWMQRVAERSTMAAERTQIQTDVSESDDSSIELF